MHDVLGFILGGGRGAGLFPLTKYRSTPAVPVAGKYRLIDIPISNCINSGIQRIYVLTQFLSVSLHRHIGNTYKFAPFTQNFVEVLAAQQTNETADWYRGTADAMRQNLRYLHASSARDVLILSGDGLYRFHFKEMVDTHRDSGADLTIAVVPVRRSQAPSYGIAQLDDSNRLVQLVEKPADAQLEAVRAAPAWLERRGLAGTGREFLANMGIYLCRRTFLLELLSRNPAAVDLVTQLYAPAVATHHVQAHLYDSYWQDLGGSIRAYHEANLALASNHPPFDFSEPDGVIYTRMRNLPASTVRASQLRQALISDGCWIETGARLERCVIGQRMRIGRDVVIRDTVISGADRYETDEQRRANREQGIPDIGIGDGSVITRAIVDKDARIGRNVKIVNEREIQHQDSEQYVIRDGIVVVPNGSVLADGTVI